MKKLLLSFSFLVFSVFAHSQIVNIPDYDFKTSLINYQPTIDTNNDNEIQVSEALAVTYLNFTNANLIGNPYNLTGIEAFTNLTYLSLTITNLTSLNLAGLTNLQTLNCYNCGHLTNLDLNGLTGLQSVDCSSCFNLTTLNLNGATNIQSLNCSFCHLTSLDLTGLNQLTTVNCSDNSLNSLITTGANSIITLNCSANNLTSLIVTGMTNLQNLNCSTQDMGLSNGLSVLDLTGLNFITSLNCRSNNLSALDISHLNLTLLNCNYNIITSLNVSNSTNLTNLSCGGNQLSALDVSALTQLSYLDCHGNILNNLNIDNLVNLVNIDCGQNSIPSLNVSNNTLLTFLACAGNQLTTLDLSNLVNLTDLICSTNQLTTMDFSNLHHLTRVEVGWNLFTSIDLSQTISVNNYNYYYYSFNGNPNLTHINIKNGSSGSIFDFSAYNCPALMYICADEPEIQSIQQALGFDSGSGTPNNLPVNSYCNFVPGGVYNTINGTVTLDNNNNGCDVNDIHPRDFKININDATTSGATFSLSNGTFSFFTQTGDYVLAPQFDNSYFSITPTTSTLNFANLDNSTQTQNYCITANGIHNDVDIALWPIRNARPGFDADYMITYRNKGNQILAGNINLTFDDVIFDFVSANPTLDNQSLNNLTWNYTNLLPFESRTIYFTLNLNGPTETPAVNIDDVLNFDTTINPVSGDETPDDNAYHLTQTVRGSFDPNDKICLEGNAITPDKVGDYLHYMIHFQNSGTAPAENIVVKDIIDTTKFDVSSLQLTASSHPQVTRITGNKVEFVFENINLPAEIDNEPASHGYVAFKIKTKSTLVLGNNVENTANIYFDYNYPIVTNTTSTTVSTLGVHDFENTSVSVSPNPVKNILAISADDVITSIQLFDIQGRLISTKLNAAMQASLDLSQQSAGVYFVKVYTDNGMKVEKIIKQ